MLQLKQLHKEEILQALTANSLASLSLEEGLFFDLDFLALVPELEELHIACCFYLDDSAFQKIGSLKKLRKLTIDYTNFLTTLNFLESLPHLQVLELTRCTQLLTIQPIGMCKELTHLTLAASGMVRIADFLPLQQLKKLEYLDLSQLLLLHDLHFLEGLTHLKYLNVNFCVFLEDISALKNMPSLTALHVSECSLLQEQLGFIVERRLPEFTPPEAVRERRALPLNMIKA